MPFWPDAAWKDVVFALAVGTIVLVLTIVVGPAELGRRASPVDLNVDPRPDWYLLWYFALLALIPPVAEDWVIIGFPLLIAVILFLLPFIAPAGERSPRRRPRAVGIVMLSVIAVAVLI
jgi:ubiquinol-cytochrome c reductase cytochrome b subunit